MKIFEHVLGKIKKDEIDYCLSYCHYSLVDQSLNQIIEKFSQVHPNLKWVNGSPLHMGMLTENGKQNLYFSNFFFILIYFFI